MEFVVNFTSRTVLDYVLFADGFKAGLGLLDDARERLGVSIPHELLDQDVSTKSAGSYRLYLTESEARQTGRFWEKGNVSVITSKEVMREFMYLDMAVCRDTETDEIKSVKYQWSVDKSALFAAWKGDGFPVRWELK